ncbi:MAG: hypothetical protein A2V96_02420 [Candidatus Yonathbacteria bacterium RBG_16_43_6]|uniref:Uncharacterized protein n=2 Tax=Parcubacteria group TaxID=1794811 RepID=A0A1G2SBP3_9BACT|nr:MAG: hypothetical protein UW78_C0011G0007 [Candidatus Azambacteria bacterium GW2011_GWA1_44_9]OHA78472.1 MAG: hypothetical protein A2V96_02420 [Candidatus Yonathbacteria bacterium RBG_16_43_6]OHA82447.1 MAG: hypothetical protein A3B07_02375 [Candidatus Yonathbacteria bacterium RIFCSPLOWO2_01_FULL_43_27]
MFKKIQEKPEHVKKRISFIITLVIFSVIVFVWVSSRTARMVINESRTRSASPIESFKEIFNGGISGIQNTITNAEFFGGGNIEVVQNAVPPVALQQPASSTLRFDTSGVVIIDLATSTKSVR